MEDALLAETIRIDGHGGESIEAYLARPLGRASAPGVVVIHHLPGWDGPTKEITRTFAAHGYTAICPNLHGREGDDPIEASAAVRAAGGVPDERCLGDLAGAVRYLRAMPSATGAVGIIGYCSGGRQAYLAACALDVDAAIDCYGGGVTLDAHEPSDRKPVAPIERTAELSCPLLGLFGADDQNPSPAQVETIRQALTEHGKEFELHVLEGAGHAFFSVDRPHYRVEAAARGWALVHDWFDRHLRGHVGGHVGQAH